MNKNKTILTDKTYGRWMTTTHFWTITMMMIRSNTRPMNRTTKASSTADAGRAVARPGSPKAPK